MRALASLVSAGAISAVGPVPASKPSEAATPRVMPSLPPRRPVAIGRWIPYAVWTAAAVWILVNFALFHVEPLGFFPASAERVAALNQLRATRAREDLLQLTGAVGQYAAVAGALPPGLEVLGARDPTVATRLLDPWGHPYQIQAAAGGAASVVSAGPDGRFGTADDIGLETS